MLSRYRIAFAPAWKPYRTMGFCSHIRAVISARFSKEAKLRRTDLLIGESHIGRWSYYIECHTEQHLPRTQTSLSRWKWAGKGRREGDNGRDGALPAVCTLPMVPCGSSPVPHLYLALYLAKNKAPEEEAGIVRLLSCNKTRSITSVVTSKVF